MMTAKLNQLLNRLQAVAEGKAYDGEALREALDTLILTTEERPVIERFLFGTHRGTDHVALQTIVVEMWRDGRE